jgi:hypothetical protein
MRRVVFTLAASVMLTLATAFPVASSELTNVTLTCNDGTSITGEVDTDTLAGLVDAVQSLALYPAGLTCALIQIPVLHALGGVASAWPGGGFIVGGGRFQATCANGLMSYWVNFAISAHTETAAAGPVKGGTLNFTVPGGQACVDQGHVTSKPTCLKINAEQPKPPAGAWYAYVRSHVTEKSGSLTWFPDDFGSGWKDTGNPGKQTSPDRVAIEATTSCPADGSPNPDGSNSVPILNGGVTIHAEP